MSTSNSLLSGKKKNSLPNLSFISTIWNALPVAGRRPSTVPPVSLKGKLCSEVMDLSFFKDKRSSKFFVYNLGL